MKSDESPAVTSVQNLENGASSEKKLNSGASLCTERVIRMRNRDIPPTLVGIQAISLLLCASALIISGKFIKFTENVIKKWLYEYGNDSVIQC